MKGLRSLTPILLGLCFNTAQIVISKRFCSSHSSSSIACIINHILVFLALHCVHECLPGGVAWKAEELILCIRFEILCLLAQYHWLLWLNCVLRRSFYPIYVLLFLCFQKFAIMLRASLFSCSAELLSLRRSIRKRLLFEEEKLFIRSFWRLNPGHRPFIEDFRFHDRDFLKNIVLIARALPWFLVFHIRFQFVFLA